MADDKFFDTHGPKKSKYPKTAIKHMFRENPTKPGLVNPNDKFITDHSAKQYCSLLSTKDEKLPVYLEPLETFLNNVLDIPEEVFEDIGKVHVEREWKFREEEKKEEERLQKIRENEMEMKHGLDSEVYKILNTRRKYIKRSCPVRIPFKSTLTHEEHEFYIRCFIKYQIRGPANSLEKAEHEKYMSMQNTVFDEQSCMMNFSFKVSQLNLNQYNSVSNPIENYINEYFLHRCQRATSYPEHYKNEIEIPLKPIEENKTIENFQFKYVGHLLSLGRVKWLNLPNSNRNICLPKDELVAKNCRPNCDEDFDKDEYLYKCPVSEDPNAEYLAQAHRVSVVMSASAFKTIVDNQEQPFDKEWNIPIRIKPSKIKENGKEVDTRIIYFDKPLPKKSWLPLQKKHTFFKASAKGVLTKHSNFSCFKMKQVRPVDNYSSERSIRYDTDLFGVEDNSVDSFEMGGSSYSKLSSPSSEIIESDLFLSEDEDASNSHEEKKSKCDNVVSQPCFSTPVKPFTKSYNNEKFNYSSLSKNKTKSMLPSQLPTPIPGTVGKRKCQGDSNDSHVNSNLEQKSTNHMNDGFLDNLLGKQESLLSSKPSETYDKASSSVQSRIQDDMKSHQKGKKQQRHENVDNVETPHASKDTGVLDNIFNRQTSFLNTKTPHVTQGNISTLIAPIMGKMEKKKKPWSNSLETDWKNYKYKNCPYGGGTNVHYQLFSFEKTDQCPAKKDRSEPVRILVRHNIHGLTRFNKEERSSEAYVIYPKIENQSYFGCEVNSLSEVAQQWAMLLVRPNTTLLQVRICVESGSVLMAEEKTLETVVKDGKQKHINFNPQSVFSTLNVLFNTLHKMSSGNYLLHHDPKTEAFMNLMKAVDAERATFSTNSLNLHKCYSESEILTRKYKSAPWLALDTHVLTPFHLTHKKIPATFPMANVRKLNCNERKRRKEKAFNKMSIKGYD